MRKIKAVYMRGGTSKGLLFHKKDLPEDKAEWDSIFLQAMCTPDPKQIDGMGGTVSSNNKIVVIWESDKDNIDIEYLVGQVVAGRNQVDYKSNCGNMTAAVGPFAVEENLVLPIYPTTNIRLLNLNTNKIIDVDVPIQNGTFAQEGDCAIAGIDGKAAEIRVNFLSPAGSKTGKLAPTGNLIDIIYVPGVGKIEITILDVSNPLVMVRAEDIGLVGTELPEDVNGNAQVCGILEKIRGIAATLIGCAENPEDATLSSPAIPKIGFFSTPKTYTTLGGKLVEAGDTDLCVRIISVFKCHKASPVTSAGAVAVMALLGETVLGKTIKKIGNSIVRIGHPSGVTTIISKIENAGANLGKIEVESITLLSTARRIMDGTLYIRD